VLFKELLSDTLVKKEQQQNETKTPSIQLQKSRKKERKKI